MFQELHLIPMKEIEIFGIKIHPLRESEFLSIIELNFEKGITIIQEGVNAASILEIIKNSELREAINNSNLVNIDGISVVWALRFLGYKIPERVPCPNLAEKILALAELRNLGVFLLGAKDESLLFSKNKLRERYPKLRVVGYRNGYFSENEELEIVNMINDASPDILFLGMPSPKKELFIEKYKNSLHLRYALGVGGFFDILSGKIRRAPLWIQIIGMEWFFRLIQEPKRMWRRYLVGNIQFIRLVLKEKFRRVFNQVLS